MIKLVDTFNGLLISRHRTLENAIKAKRRHQNAITRRYGYDVYMTYDIRCSDGTSVDFHSMLAAEDRLDNKLF